MLAPTKPVKSCECGSPCGGCCCCTKESIGLGNVDNTSDLNKPLSADMINALSGKVDLDTFTQLKNRVSALENTITEIPDLKFKIRQCELNIIDHYKLIKELQNTTKSMNDTITELGNRVTEVNDGLVTVGTRVDALEDKDRNNVKLTGVSEQTIVGKLKANDPTNGVTDKTLVTANWVSQTGDSGPNNLIHKNGNESKIGNFSATTLIANKTLRYANSIVIKDSYLPSNTSIPTNTSDANIAVIAGDASEIMNCIVRTQADGTRILRIGLHDTVTGANHLFNLITISPNGTVTYPWS